MIPASSVPGSAVPGSFVPGAASALPASWPDYYTFNFCPNPSAEVSTAGYSALRGSEQVAQGNIAYSGQSSVQVTTPGTVPGEGISTPSGAVVANAMGSATVYLYGEKGTLVVQAVQNPGGQILATTIVQLDGQGWQRAELDGLSLFASSSLQLLIFTSTAQAVTFYADAVQYEPESPAHPYIDGSSRYSTWTGTPGLSTSYQQYENTLIASGSMTLEGSIALLTIGEVVTIGPISGQMDMSGNLHDMCAVSGTRSVIAPAIDTGVPGMPWEISGGGSISVTVVSPGAALSDFAVFETGVDPDPAMTLIGWNNAGTQNAGSGATAYTRNFATFSPPRQQLDSAGNARWQAAAYMAAGFRIANQAVWAAGAPGTVNFTDVQVEKMTQQGPTAYQLPRSLSTIIRPTNMNYVTNPSAEVSTAGWSTFGGATITQVSGGKSGAHSFQVSVPSAGGGVYVTVPDLITGDVFTASAYIEAVSANIQDVTLSIAGQTASANPTGYPYGYGAYGAGPYGGVDPASGAMTTGSFAYRPWVPFTSPASAVVLSFTPAAITGAVYPLVFNIDAVLVSPGEALTAYGDGDSSGWQWEAGGTPGLCRSYYYERQGSGMSAVEAVLDRHIPLGLTAYAPQVAVPPTQ